MQQIYDTNILIDEPDILLKSNSIIPYFILEELEKNKNDLYGARQAIRNILDNDIKCRKMKVSGDTNDEKLIQLGIKKYKIFTKDAALYLKAKSRNSNVFYYEKDEENLYEGLIEKELDPKVIDKLYNKGKVKTNMDLYENQFIDSENIICKYNEGYLHKIKWKNNMEGVGKLNRRQIMLSNLLFDKDVTVVSIIGGAGTGKTSLAINSAIKQVKRGQYDRIILTRPKVQKGFKEEKFGSFPGSLSEKLNPFLQPYWDNIKEQTMLNFEVEGLSLIQGRNIENSILLVTESQNIHPKDMDCIIERIGKNSKVVFEGDIEQINNKKLSKNYNGLSCVINYLKNKKLTGSILLDEVMRSETAKLGKLYRDRLGGY